MLTDHNIKEHIGFLKVVDCENNTTVHLNSNRTWINRRRVRLRYRTTVTDTTCYLKLNLWTARITVRSKRWARAVWTILPVEAQSLDLHEKQQHFSFFNVRVRIDFLILTNLSGFRYVSFRFWIEVTHLALES